MVVRQIVGCFEQREHILQQRICTISSDTFRAPHPSSKVLNSSYVETHFTN